MRRISRNVLLGMAIALAALEAVYLVAANIFINTPLAPETINRRPERFQIRWRSGWSLWPGMAHLQDVEVRGRSSRIDWYSHLDSVTTTFHVEPLLQRTVHLIDVRAEGVVYRQRRWLLPGETSRVPATELPPLPERIDAPSSDRSPAKHAGSPGGQPWRVMADAIHCDLSELWIDRFRLAGRLRVDTSMDLTVRGPMGFPRIRLSLHSGDLFAGEGAIFKALDLDADASLSPFGRKDAAKLGFFHYLSGRFSLRSPSASLFFLEAYFRKTPWIHFNERAGGSLEMILDRGVLQPGSKLQIANDNIDINFIDRRLTGKGVITGEVSEREGKEESSITVYLIEFQLSPLDGMVAFARGRDAVLTARSDSLDLSNPFTDVRVSVDVPQAQILDISFYNSMIPPGSKFHLNSGTGTLRYHLEGSSQARSLHGDIELAVKDASAMFEDYEMRGDFTLKTPLREASPREMLFDISGTRLDLKTAKWNWTATYLFPKARMKFSDPMKIDATVQLRMTDTRPLVAMFDALKGASHWIENMMIIEGISGKARLEGSNDRMDVKDVEVDGKGLKALADLKLGKQHREGILYIHFHGFSLGIKLRKDGRELKIFRPRHWFEQER